MVGGSHSPNLPEAVTLNSFQGPFLGLARITVRRRDRALSSLSATTERAARWTLKQVQGDDEVRLAL